MFRQLSRSLSRQFCRTCARQTVPLRSRCLSVSQLQIGPQIGLGLLRSFQTSIRTFNQPPEPSLPREDYTEAQWLDYLHRVSFAASQSQKILAELDAKSPDAGIFDAPNRMERAYALIFQLFLFLSRPQPNSSPEHYLQTFETLPSFDGDDLHLARLCAIHVVRTIVWELDSIPTSDPHRAKYPNVFEDAKGLSMLCEQFLKDHESVPETWSLFWSEAQQALVALGMDLGDAGYAIQAPPDPTETPEADPDAPGLTRAEGFKGVDLTGNAGAPVRGAPNVLETAQPGDDVPDRIEMEYEAKGKEALDREKNSKKRGGFF
ncbi:hypothetical protein RSOLAG1IB_04066 [Rhizoctonia solani AG-1 IB]|uniref:Uncharacterized protein n=1 Tax=Thanatephorus cucumeris (strain AG1-IB / isolate 7/3/14) TaxID=1108050 RepID=A0A0B7FXB0_THACB|nr:hypothetical protein RSOLAG1IB_04066 [Rhizoctonia solani AG-1 IB]